MENKLKLRKVSGILVFGFILLTLGWPISMMGTRSGSGLAWVGLLAIFAGSVMTMWGLYYLLQKFEAAIDKFLYMPMPSDSDADEE